MNWEIDEPAQALYDFTRDLIGIMQSNAVLRRRHFFAGTNDVRTGEPDVVWIRSDGEEMTDADWKDESNQAIGMLMPGRSGDEVDARGRAIVGETLFWLLNAGGTPRSYTLPKVDRPGIWEELFSTARPGGRVVRTPAVNLTGHSTVLLRRNENPAK
jgi:glycogen operon protein